MYIHVYVYVYIYTQTYMCMYVCMYIHTCLCTHICVEMCTHTFVCTHILTHIKTRVYIYKYTHPRAPTCIYIHLHVYICVHVPMCVRICVRALTVSCVRAIWRRHKDGGGWGTGGYTWGSAFTSDFGGICVFFEANHHVCIDGWSTFWNIQYAHMHVNEYVCMSISLFLKSFDMSIGVSRFRIHNTLMWTCVYICIYIFEK